MRKNNLYAAFVVIAMILIIIFTRSRPELSSYPLSSNTGTVAINIIAREKICSSIQNDGERDVCYMDVLKTEKNITICNKLVDFHLKITCYADVAAATKNPNVCVKLTTDSWRDSCYLAAADAKNDPVICGSIIFEETRHLCYQKIDLSNISSMDVCPKMWTKETKAECFSILKELT